MLYAKTFPSGYTPRAKAPCAALNRDCNKIRDVRHKENYLLKFSKYFRFFIKVKKILDMHYFILNNVLYYIIYTYNVSYRKKFLTFQKFGYCFYLIDKDLKILRN